MDLYDTQILQTLKQHKTAEFHTILSQVDFSHNTLREHLKKLTQQGIITRKKKQETGPGRPTYTYSLPAEVKKNLTSLLNPELGLVSLPSERVRQI